MASMSCLVLFFCVLPFSFIQQTQAVDTRIGQANKRTEKLLK